MNYHIMIDEKFIDDFITDSENISSNNIYIIRGVKYETSKVHNHKAIFSEYGSSHFFDLTKEILETDKVFIHWLDYNACNFILNHLNPKSKVYVLVWGGEFYEDPIRINKHWLYDKISYKYYESQQLYSLKFANSFWDIIKRPYRWYCDYQNAKKMYKLKQAALKRTTYLIMHPKNNFEYKLICTIYKVKPILLGYFYGGNVIEEAIDIGNFSIRQESLKSILIGNSDTLSNNHLDCFKFLQELKNFDSEISIYCPLSYSVDDDYRQLVKESGHKIFSNFYPIEVFMTRKDYIEMLNKTTSAIMFHNRSQAFNNIKILISLGKRIFLKEVNPCYQFLIKIGVNINTIEELKNNPELLFTPLDPLVIKNNISALTKEFNEKHRSKSLYFIYQNT